MMSRSVVNHLLLTQYKKVLSELYVEPKNEEIVWTFHIVGNEEGKQAEAKLQQQKSNREERRSEIWGIFSNPRPKKDDQENYCTWLAYLFRRSAISLFKSNLILCLPRVEKSQT